jgi:uncharacterized protein (TIGR03083 family)
VAGPGRRRAVVAEAAGAAGAAAAVDAAAAEPVAAPTVEQYCAEIAASTAVLAGLAGRPDLSTPVPTCPDWTLRELTIHVGRAHRWAAEIVGTRSAEFVPFRSVPDGKFPGEPADREAWLLAGAGRVVDAVREAASDPVWTFSGLQPASFWARRMAHETAMHRADAQLAVGSRPSFGAPMAADAIDESLVYMSSLAGPGQDPRAAALPAGGSLHVHATDPELAGGEWTVRNEPAGVTVERAHGKGDAALRGPAGDLLLVLTRRLPPGEASVEVHGDAAILAGWLAGTSY